MKPRWFALVSPCSIAGDLNADPVVFPVLAKVFLLVGMLTWLLLILRVLVLLLMLLVGVIGEEGTGSPHFSLTARFS